MYRQESAKLLESISRLLPPGAEPFRAPDLKFHRAIGEYAGKTFSVTGEPLTAEEYEKHIAEVLPNEQEKAFIYDLMREPGWIAPRTEITTS
jgi:hypothetical protein